VSSHSGGPVLAEPDLVPTLEPLGGGTSDEVATVEESVETTIFRSVSSEPRDSKLTRLVAGEKSLKSRGFSDSAIKRILAPQAPSTGKVYDAKWKEWVNWSSSRVPPVDFRNPSLPQLADFFLHLFEVLKRSVSTIKGYRSSIASSLRFSSSLDISGSQELSNLLKQMERERPPRSLVVPQWDLSLVLWTLTEPPFESIWQEQECPLKFLTWKVAFLLLLASGARRGELHSIPFKNVSYDRAWSHLTLKPDPSFLSKTRLRTGQALQPFRIPALTPLLSQGLENDKKLCPVRSAKAYITRSQHLRTPEKKLFLVSHDPKVKKDISVNTVSSWVSHLIEFAYKSPGPRALQLTGKKAHEVRAYASSLVHKGCWSIEDVVASGQWTNPNTFIDHYLRDLSEQADGISRVGPIVAGQKVIQDR